MTRITRKNTRAVMIDMQDKLLGGPCHTGRAEARNARCVLETKTIAALKRSVQWLRDNKQEADRTNA